MVLHCGRLGSLKVASEAELDVSNVQYVFTVTGRRRKGDRAGGCGLKIQVQQNFRQSPGHSSENTAYWKTLHWAEMARLLNHILLIYLIWAWFRFSEEHGSQMSMVPILRRHMKPGIDFLQKDRETVETEVDFICRGSKITADGDCSREIKRHLFLGKLWPT